MDDKLKPCPFCGSTPYTSDAAHTTAGVDMIICSKCGCRMYGGSFSTWNNRQGDSAIRAEARADAALLYERQYEELRTWNAERSTQERWWDMIARHKHERDVFILGDEPKERKAKRRLKEAER